MGEGACKGTKGWTFNKKSTFLKKKTFYPPKVKPRRQTKKTWCLTIPMDRRHCQNRSLDPRNNSLAIAIGLFKKKLATLTKILGVRFTPKFFWKNTETMSYRIFIVPYFFVLYANFTPVHMNFKLEPQKKNILYGAGY